MLSALMLNTKSIVENNILNQAFGVMHASPVQILIKYLTDYSNCEPLCVHKCGPIHGTVFFPQGLKVSAIVCVENGLNLVG